MTESSSLGVLPPAERRPATHSPALSPREVMAAAQALFAAQGYEQTSLEQVAAQAGVSELTLRRDFSDKSALFRAVLEDQHRRTILLVGEAFARKRDPWQGMLAGTRVYLDRVCDPGVRRITLVDGPHVLGWDSVQDIGSSYCLLALEESLHRLIEDGGLVCSDVGALSHLLYGAFSRAARRVALAPDPAAARRASEREVRALIKGLAATSQPTPAG